LNADDGDDLPSHSNVYSQVLKAAYGMAVRLGSTIACPAIVCMQGEYDYNADGNTPKDTYRDGNLSGILCNFR
jgi:hypothetical protein